MQVPFLFALDIHVRLLVALPLLIAAELYVHEWSRGIVAQFLDHGIIACEDRPDLGYFVVIQIQKFRYLLLEGLRIAG